MSDHPTSIDELIPTPTPGAFYLDLPEGTIWVFDGTAWVRYDHRAQLARAWDEGFDYADGLRDDAGLRDHYKQSDNPYTTKEE